MRLLLVLLALLTGLSLPDVAVATSRTEVAGAGLSAGATVSTAARQRTCIVRARLMAPLHIVVQRRPVWSPTQAYVAPCNVLLSDRARQ